MNMFREHLDVLENESIPTVGSGVGLDLTQWVRDMLSRKG